ncbi:hypothetical protein Tco_1056376 [Tanacetum coccineum]|uniref:Uncharacterized protein n=1 Tax=Tanacetum coccineum TaxID=301880 RepID=A0ABQ5H3H8_9ASTR
MLGTLRSPCMLTFLLSRRWPIENFAPEVEHIGSSSSRPQLTDTVIDITPLEEQSNDPPQTTPKDNRGKGIARDIDESLCKLVPASKEIHPDPDTPMLIPYEINGKLYQLTNEQIHAHLKNEEKLERVAQEAKLIKLNKHVLIKVVEEVASETGINPSALSGKKGGQEFLKQHDVELKVHQREHMVKVKKSNELKKKRYNQYVWTTTNRLKPEKITDIHIHPNTKQVAIIVYRNNEKKINSNTSCSQPIRQKRKALKLEPKGRIAGLECNRSLLEGIPFVNNKVIETPKYRIFFTDALDEQAFQRVSDIHKVEVETLLGYLVMAGNVNTLENQRFCVLLTQMIDAHPDREKLKLKKVKLEAIGYSFK